MRKLTYFIDNQPYEGTIEDYANALRHGSLESVDVYGSIVTDDGQWVKAETEFSGYNVNDMGYATVKIPGYGESGYVVDGSA